MRRNHGFTLIELLVVVAVVAVLAALSMGALNKVTAATSSTKCLGNLKTIGGAMRGYTADNNGYFPPHNSYAFFETNGLERIRKSKWHWMAHLAPYLGSPDATGPMSSVFDCPADPKVKTWPTPRPYIPESPSAKSHTLSSYGYNYWHLTTTLSFWPRDPAWVVNANVIGNPAKLILVTDGRANDGDPIVGPYSAVNSPTMRHGGRFNAVFLDGHVAGMGAEGLASGAYWIGK